MKKQTQQTPQDPCLKGPSAVPAIMVGAIAGIMLLGLGVGSAIKHVRKNVTCHECDHIVARSSATQKKRFKHAFGRDDKYTTLYFCKQHRPVWDYALGSDAEEFYFKTQKDWQVTRSGLEITNIIWGGTYFYFGKNDMDMPRIEHRWTTTNIGGTMSAKHINH